MSGSFEHISECRMAVCHAVLETGMQGHGDIEIFWLSDYVPNWPANSVHCAADHFYVSTGIENDFRDVFSFNPPITGCHHLMGARRLVHNCKPHRRPSAPPFGISWWLSLIHISEPTRLLSISYAVFCLKKKNQPPT